MELLALFPLELPPSYLVTRDSVGLFVPQHYYFQEVEDDVLSSSLQLHCYFFYFNGGM